MKDIGFDFDKPMDRWLFYLLTGELIEANEVVRPTGIADGCELDTEKLNEAYVKSESTKEYKDE
tara:strand:+ start:644 stop:835 length:192 start_codon:yes stop_codon:yes gene_type:complete